MGAVFNDKKKKKKRWKKKKGEQVTESAALGTGGQSHGQSGGDTVAAGRLVLDVFHEVVEHARHGRDGRPSQQQPFTLDLSVSSSCCVIDKRVNQFIMKGFIVHILVF